MATRYMYRAHCGRDVKLGLAEGGENYILLEGCDFCSISAGVPLAKLIEMCAQCQKSKIQEFMMPNSEGQSQNPFQGLTLPPYPESQPAQVSQAAQAQPQQPQAQQMQPQAQQQPPAQQQQLQFQPPQPQAQQMQPQAQQMQPQAQQMQPQAPQQPPNPWAAPGWSPPPQAQQMPSPLPSPLPQQGITQVPMFSFNNVQAAPRGVEQTDAYRGPVQQQFPPLPMNAQVQPQQVQPQQVQPQQVQPQQVQPQLQDQQMQPQLQPQAQQMQPQAQQMQPQAQQIPQERKEPPQFVQLGLPPQPTQESAPLPQFQQTQSVQVEMPNTTSEVKLVQPVSCGGPYMPESVVIASGFATKPDELDADFNGALASVGLEGGPSEGGFSWHTLENCMHCWRLAYYTLIQGLMPLKYPKPLAFGSLYHACWELWYKSGGQRSISEPCEAVAKAGAPEIAGHAQRLVIAELNRYAQEEADTWDIRAVEQNAVFWAAPQRINGKTVHVPFCCRHDQLIAKRQLGQPVNPPGPVATGITIVDRKTAGALTYDLTKGYAQDGQFLMNAVCYMKSDEVEVFGPLSSMIFAVAVKHENPTPEKSFFRVETMMSDAAIEEFYQYEILPFGTELYRRIASDAIRNDITKWPKNRASCVGKYGCCKFFNVCDEGEHMIDMYFKVDPTRILTLDKLWEPPPEKKRAERKKNIESDPKKIAAEAKRVFKKERRKHLSALVLNTFQQAIQADPAFDKSKFLTEGHTTKGVAAKLTAMLKTFWAEGTEFEFGPDAEGHKYQMKFVGRGIEWGTKETAEDGTSVGFNGVMTYKTIADAVCTDWWDITKNPPTPKS